MTNKMGLMALGLSVALLSGCSSDNDTTDPVTTETATTETATTETATTETATTETATTETAATASGFTPELLVGKTYVIIDGDEEETVSFSETEISFSGNGETGTLPYSIDANGVLIVYDSEGDIIVTLIGIEESGNLNVIDNEIETVWVLISSGTTTSGFTPELLVGKTYFASESTGFESTLTITESGIYNDVDDIIYPYTIDASGALVFEDGFFIHITSIDENGDLHVIDSEGTTGVWVLVS